MNQAVYNTYKAIGTGDASRILEHTNPHDTAAQVKRMAIHNDIILAFMAPFYFINEGPETLLVIQTVILALGSLFVYLIGREVLKKYAYSEWISCIIGFAYLLYPALQKANAYDFHGVTLATTFLLAMYYFWLKKWYSWTFFCIVLALFTKEQLGLTTAMFGCFVIIEYYLRQTGYHFSLRVIANLWKNLWNDAELRYAFITIIVSLLWVVLSMKLIIPFFRGGEHFATDYYDHVLREPWSIPLYLFGKGSVDYLRPLLSPLGFLSLLSPLHFLIALPDLLINLLSSNENMRNIYFHYTSVITPFVFISAIYGIRNAFYLKKKIAAAIPEVFSAFCIIALIAVPSLFYSYRLSSLPYAKHQDLFPWKAPAGKYEDVMAWKMNLAPDDIKVSSTGVLAPHFTSRIYFYDFSWKYTLADYVIIDEKDALSGYLKKNTLPAYKMIQNDKKYIKIYDRNGIIVYKKLHTSL
jgi:uncharacterized membrane protein